MTDEEFLRIMDHAIQPHLAAIREFDRITRPIMAVVAQQLDESNRVFAQVVQPIVAVLGQATEAPTFRVPLPKADLELSQETVDRMKRRRDALPPAPPPLTPDQSRFGFNQS